MKCVDVSQTSDVAFSDGEDRHENRVGARRAARSRRGRRRSRLASSAPFPTRTSGLDERARAHDGRGGSTGDSLGDRATAENAGMRFIAVRHDAEPERWESDAWIASVDEIAARMKEIHFLTWQICEQAYGTGALDTVHDKLFRDMATELAHFHGMEAGYRFRLHELYTDAIS